MFKWPAAASVRAGLVMAFLGAMPLQAQSRPDANELEARLDSLSQVYQALNARWQPISEDMNQIDLDEVSTLDSTMVGPIRVIAPAAELALAVDAVEGAISMLFPILGETSLPQALNGQGFYGFSSRDDRVTESEELRPFALREGWRDWGISPAATQVQAAINAGLPLSVVAWSGHRVIDPSLTDGHGREQVLRIMSPLATTCILERDMKDCETLFDLDFSDDPAQREAFVADVFPNDVWKRLVESRSMSRRSDDFTRCVGDSPDQSACFAILTSPINRGNVQAVPQAVRARLMQAAVVMGGGAPAWDRVDALPDGATPREALEAASQASAEAVIEVWLDSFLTARPRSTDPGEAPSTRLAGLWIVLLAGFSLFSTRWRLQ